MSFSYDIGFKKTGDDMFIHDYIMRLIHEMVRGLLKTLFNIDTDALTSEMVEDSQYKKIYENLTMMIDDGEINEAENILYSVSDENDKESLKIVLMFYSYLNDKSDEFLTEHNFSREEIVQDIQALLDKYGLGDLSKTLLMNQ